MIEETTLNALRLNVKLERCGQCRKWHKSKHYDCQHNGPWGGCSAKQETKFEPKKVRSNELDQAGATK